jgi:gliding motility-associated-like protein
VQPKPKVDFNTPAVVCLPDGRATFSNLTTVGGSGGTPLTYLWNFGLPGAFSTQQNPTWKYNTAGSYPIFLKATSARGCTDSLIKPFDGVVPQAMANWSANPPEVCLGEEIAFTDLSNPLNNTITGWNWQFGDGSSSNQQNPSKTYLRSGTYNVAMFYNTAIGCPSDTITKQVIIHPYPVVDAGPDLFLLQGGQQTIRATVTGSNNYAYLWSPATWLSDPTILQPITKAEDDITYTITVTGAGGCAGTDEVFVKQLLKPIIPNAFSPNGDGINDTWIIRHLDSYPGATVQVFDRYGKSIFISTGYNQPWNGTTGGKPVPAGVYYYIVDPKNGMSRSQGSVTVIR